MTPPSSAGFAPVDSSLRLKGSQYQIFRSHHATRRRRRCVSASTGTCRGEQIVWLWLLVRSWLVIVLVCFDGSLMAHKKWRERFHCLTFIVLPSHSRTDMVWTLATSAMAPWKINFGCSAFVARKAWIMIQPLLDVANPSFTNYLGALMFMYGYPLEKQMCSLMGVTDPRTMHRRIEPYVDALFELNYEVVSCELQMIAFVILSHYFLPDQFQ